MTKKKIAIFTSIRSEYGLLFPVIEKLNHDNNFELSLLVGGAHLLEEYGLTINQIKADGFDIAATFPFLDNNISKNKEVYAMSLLQNQIGEYLSEAPPDFLVVLGDRFELLPVVSSCLVMNIPIVHISGGDVTEGAIDNQIRHAITKMAHIHFPATEIYKQNLMKMGEEEWRICVSGEPGLDHILNFNSIPKDELYLDLSLDTKLPVVCCTFHPETIGDKISPDFIKELLIQLVKNDDIQVLITASNFDKGGTKINNMLEELSKKNRKIIYVKSLGQKRYYSLMKYASYILGNSSSGIVEAQSFNLPAINIGNRQAGRLSNRNVIHVPAEMPKIMTSIKEALSEGFKSQYLNFPNIYGDGKAAIKIVNFLSHLPDKQTLLLKKSVFNE